MFWIFAENRVVLIIVEQCFSASHSTHLWEGCGGRAGRGHSWDRWPQWIQGIFQIIWDHVQHINPGEGEESRGCSEQWCLSSQVLPMTKLCFPGIGWTSACPSRSYELINFCFPSTSFTLSIKLFFSTHRLSLFYSSDSLPIPLGWVTQQLHELPSGIFGFFKWDKWVWSQKLF